MTSGAFLIDPISVWLPKEGDWSELFEDAVPLHVEIGFGKDVRTLRRAQAEPESRFVGIEISGKKARSFCKKVARLGLTNVRAHCGDVRPVLMERLPAASVDTFTILFPDPWPKRRQSKHRWIQPHIARLIVRALKGNGEVITATDHDGYAAQIRECLLGAGLTLLSESDEIPDEDRSMFAQRFARLGESVTHQRWRK